MLYDSEKFWMNAEIFYFSQVAQKQIWNWIAFNVIF